MATPRSSRRWLGEQGYDAQVLKTEFAGEDSAEDTGAAPAPDPDGS